MKRYIRETIEVLEGLGFTYVEDDPFGRRGKRKYTHPYEPETPLRLFDGATEAACKAIQAKAYSIADTGTSGPAMPKSIAERKQVDRDKKSRARAIADKEARARRERAERAEREYQRRQVLAKAEKNRRDIQSLMMPGRGR